jgi:hypothetical protein
MGRRLRLLLVLLLALVLPLKGALAAGGIACHRTAMQAGTEAAVPGVPPCHLVAEVAAQPSDAEAQPSDAAAQLFDAAQAPQAASQPPDADTRSAERAVCLVCVAICGMPPLPSARGPAVLAPDPGPDWREHPSLPPAGRVPATPERPPQRA